jgi:transcription elongation GreA/GreB family factor
VLERVGWRFWRCWASSFTLDPDACMADLFATLERLRIHPLGETDGATTYVERRTARVMGIGPTMVETDSVPIEKIGGGPKGVCSGDRVVIRYLDNNKIATFTLSGERHDPTNGFLSIASPLGKQLVGLVEEDETEFEIDGHLRRVLIVRTERQPATLN